VTFNRRWRAQRQHDSKDRSASRPTVDGDLAGIGFDCPPGNRQPESGTSGIPGSRFVHPEEPIEDPLPVFRRDAGSFISDGHRRVTAFLIHPDVDRRRPWTVLDRVIDDVGDRFAKHEAVCRDGNRLDGVDA